MNTISNVMTMSLKFQKVWIRSARTLCSRVVRVNINFRDLKEQITQKGENQLSRKMEKKTDRIPTRRVRTGLLDKKYGETGILRTALLF